MALLVLFRASNDMFSGLDKINADISMKNSFFFKSFIIKVKDVPREITVRRGHNTLLS